MVYDKLGRPIKEFELELDAAKYAQQKGNNTTQYYSNLTVPGGTNYTENEISTPLITPSIKGHAQYSTDNGIGWFRSDNQLINVYNKQIPDRFETADQFTYNTSLYEYKNGQWLQDGQIISSEKAENAYKREFAYKNSGTPTKTRRILELQSDLFQKGREQSTIAIKGGGSISYFVKQNEYDNNFVIEDAEGNIKAGPFKTKQEAQDRLNKFSDDKGNQFLQLLNKDNNWVKFFIQSIIQDAAKQTVTEVQESDVEAKVRELENSGLLKIKCD